MTRQVGDIHTTEIREPVVTINENRFPFFAGFLKNPGEHSLSPYRMFLIFCFFKAAFNLNCCWDLWVIKGRTAVILCITHCCISTGITYSFILVEEVTVSFHCTHTITVSMQGTCQMMHEGRRRIFEENCSNVISFTNWQGTVTNESLLFYVSSESG